MSKTSTKPRSSAAKRSKKKPVTPSSKNILGHLISKRTLAVCLLLVLVLAGLRLTHHAGPLDSLFSPVSSTAPLAQQDGTKLYTANGIASSSSILVKFKSTASPADIAAIHRQNSATVRQSISGIGVQEVVLPAGAQVGSSLKQYRSHAQVEYAEPNFVAQRFMTPNDTLYAKQWNLAKISAPTAWDVSQGGYGPIAIVDTGIDAGHSDLSGEVSGGYNFVSSSNDTTDDNGHGTHVAGIIAGVTNNTNGVASIGYKGGLMPIKVLDANGSGTYGDVASGITYAADHGAKIINLSLGGSSASQTLQSAVSYAEQRGVIVVAAAGNNGNNAAVYPADYPGVIAVSATTSSDDLASFSSYGSNIIVSAPGVGIISTYNNGGYATMSGTSMAAPEVAGLLGLALSHNSASGSTLLSDLEQSADKIGSYPYNASGWNQYFGYGRINAGKLMQLLASSPTTTPAPETSNTAPSSNAQDIHGQPSLQFSVALEGTIDSVDVTNGIIAVKVQSISQNLKLASTNLINMYVTGNTVMTSNGHSTKVIDLTAGDKISAKALWQDNQLSATSVDVQGGQTQSNNTPQAQNGSANRPTAPTANGSGTSHKP